MTDEPTPKCPVCRHEQPTWHVCPGCVQRVDQQLGDLLALHALAHHPDNLAPGRGGDGRGTDRPIGINVAVLDLAHGEVLLGVLESWERWWREHWGLSPYGVASSIRLAAPYSHSSAVLVSGATSRTLVGVVGFLRAWWPRAAEVVEPPPDEFADEVRRLHSAALVALRMQEDRPWSVACPTDDCGYRLHIEHDGRDAVLRCPRCGVSRTLENLLYVARSAGRPCWLDAEAAARALHVDIGHLGPMVRDGRIRSRGDRDRRQYDVNSVRHAEAAG